MATTASPTATPRTKACWVEHLTDRVLLEDIDESQWVFAGEWHGSHPVYQGQANADHRLYRSGSTWFYTKSGKFTKLAQAEHRDGTDPNIPPLGYGWIFCKDRSAVVGIQFSVVDSVAAMLPACQRPYAWHYQLSSCSALSPGGLHVSTHTEAHPNFPDES
eukprot:m.346469 g.346469  ORF g.346469 m.346469 type:complete len:161 (-) comp27910_c0_seq3:464-946(-)